MARALKRLSALQVKKLKQPGWYPDGDGLYLQVSPAITKSWVYRYTTGGKERRHGLGPYPVVTLDMARHAAQSCVRLRLQGLDPLDHKREQKVIKRLEQRQGISFEACALSYIESHRSSWRNAKHADQWRNTLSTYVFPVFGDLPVSDVTTNLVLQAIQPIWESRTETATRVRQRIESVLDWAKAREYRVGENPARWRGHFDKILPKPTKLKKVKHFEALPYAEMGKFYAWLKDKDSLAAHTLRPLRSSTASWPTCASAGRRHPGEPPAGHTNQTCSAPLDLGPQAPLRRGFALCETRPRSRKRELRSGASFKTSVRIITLTGQPVADSIRSANRWVIFPISLGHHPGQIRWPRSSVQLFGSICGRRSLPLVTTKLKVL